MANIFAQGDKACKGWNKRANAADVYADKQLAVVACKLWKQNCAWYVADNLAGKSRENKCVLFEQEAKKFLDRIYSCHISCENKEKHKGEK